MDKSEIGRKYRQPPTNEGRRYH